MVGLTSQAFIGRHVSRSLTPGIVPPRAAVGLACRKAVDSATWLRIHWVMFQKWQNHFALSSWAALNNFWIHLGGGFGDTIVKAQFEQLPMFFVRWSLNMSSIYHLSDWTNTQSVNQTINQSINQSTRQSVKTIDSFVPFQGKTC